ncbi:VgrG-related protein [Streptomyces xanthochromogenes]|uniref:Type IV secretion protein Rhs n=1 Tax=Streptomyces xanthochromogenes TaxID=67384 RepID=A0ABQ3AH71_9ACTN|nr:VgrG-related protein [Streptomyces xanthochromogenes]MYV88765.1 VgrG-related protein [Streptomyces sp. SID1034]GGY51703.1 type IV secretion protein Rhs [Streptomyces xanthochromogenes]
MTEKTFTTVLHVQLNGTVLPDPLALRLIEGWVDSSVNVPAAFQLTFSDKDSQLTTKFPMLKIGAKAILSPFTDGKRGDPMLTGEVTAMEVDAEPGAGRTLVVRGYDPGHRLLRNRRVEGYPNMTASDIARRVAGLNSLSIGKIESTSTVYDLATQPNITDWDFLSRLAAENDVRLSFDNKGKFNFAGLAPASGAPSDTTAAAQSPYVLDFGANTLHSRASMTAAGQVRKVNVRGWDMRTRQQLNAPSPAVTSKDIVADMTPGQVTLPFGPAELTATQVPHTTLSEVTHAARALADDVTGAFAELEVAVTGNPQLKPGTPIAVKGAGFPFEGKYTATGVRHVFASGEKYTTWLNVSGRQFRSLYGLASGGTDQAPQMPGVAVALVTNTKDPRRMGRVRLRFPWLSATYESDWCRVAQFGGRDGGGLLLPEVNDEVLCAFDRGSLEHPYVIAGLYNGIDKPTREPDNYPAVDPTSGQINWRSLTARSGHTVELLESGGAARMSSGIRLRTGKGRLHIQLNEARTALTINSDGSVEIKGMRSVDIEAGGNLSLKAGGNLSLKAGGAIEIDAGMAINVKAGLALDLKAGGEASLGAGGLLALNSVGATTLNAIANLTIDSATVLVNSPAFSIQSAAPLVNGMPIV